VHNRNGDINGVWQARSGGLNDRQLRFIEKSVFPILILRFHDDALNATTFSALLERRAQQSAQLSIIRLRRSKKIVRVPQ
jgi:hypothetical protein